MSETVDVDTLLGPGRLHIDAPTHEPQPRAVVLLGHGAGGGVSALDLEVLARRLPGAGIAVVRYEQPWRVAGRRVGVRPPQLDVGWAPAVDTVRARWPDVPLFQGGRSAGARVACRCADNATTGVICLAFPLHWPGRPDNDRTPELIGCRTPALVLQGDRDPFGSAAEVAQAASRTPSITVIEVPGTAHDLKQTERTAQPAGFVADLIAGSVWAFVTATE